MSLHDVKSSVKKEVSGIIKQNMNTYKSQASQYHQKEKMYDAMLAKVDKLKKHIPVFKTDEQCSEYLTTSSPNYDLKNCIITNSKAEYKILLEILWKQNLITKEYQNYIEEHETSHFDAMEKCLKRNNINDVKPLLHISFARLEDSRYANIPGCTASKSIKIKARDKLEIILAPKNPSDGDLKQAAACKKLKPEDIVDL